MPSKKNGSKGRGRPAVLSKKEAKDIRKLHNKRLALLDKADELSTKRLAEWYAVCPRTIWQVIHQTGTYA